MTEDIYNSGITKLIKLQNGKHKMDAVDKNPITQILSGYENVINKRCEWQQFVKTGPIALCMCVFLL